MIVDEIGKEIVDVSTGMVIGTEVEERKRCSEECSYPNVKGENQG